MKIIKDLLLAMINATLLLAAVCLFFIWQISNTVERAAGAFADNLHVLDPISTELKALRTEVSALSGDLETLSTSSGELASETAIRIQGRVNGMQTRLEDMRGNVQDMVADVKGAPEHLVKVAVTTATDNLSDMVFGLRGCTRPDASQS